MPLDPNIKNDQEQNGQPVKPEQEQPQRPTRAPMKYLYPTERFQKSLSPNQKYFYNYQIKRGEPEKQGYRILPDEWSNAMIKQYAYPNESYFTKDPRRLAKFHYFLQSAPEEWEPPDWLDPEKYNEAFNYMSEIYGDDWTQWEQLEPDDPTSLYLTTLGDPPPEFRLPNEINNQDQLLEYINGLSVNENGLISVQDMNKTELQKLNDSIYGETKELSPFMQQGTWQDLETWQRWAMSVFSPQPMEARPEWSRLTAAGFQGAQAGVAGLAIGATAGTVFGLPGTALGAILGLGIGTAAGYQAYTGQEIPGINKVLEFLDWGAITTEKVVGLAVQAADGEAREVLENLPEAWKAGEFTYEASGVGTKALNIMSGGFQVAENIFNSLGGDAEWSSGQKANYNAGQIWALERAIVEPYMIQEGYLGGEALDQIRSELISGGDFLDLYAQYISHFGFSGNVGDFIAQSVLDPLNVMPGMQGEIIGKIASKVDNPSVRANLSQAVAMNKGSLLVDAAPIGTKWIAKMFTKNKTASGGVFDIMRTYKNIIRHGGLEPGFQPTTNIMEATPLSLTNPELFSDAGKTYVDAFNNNTTRMADSDTVMVNHDGIKADLRSYIETQLESVDIDPSKKDIKQVVDRVIDNYDNIVTDVVVNNRGDTEVAFQKNLQDAFTEYIDETIGSMRWGEQEKQIKYIPELSDWERKFAGLTEEGTFKELDPTNTPKNWFQKLTKLDTESQAITYLQMLYTNLSGILTMEDGNPDGQVALFRQAAGVDPVRVGQQAASILESPATKTTAPVMKAFVDSGTLDNLYASWMATQNQRAELNTIANSLNLEVGKLLQDLEDNPTKVMNMINNVDIGALDDLKALSPEELSARFEVFWGDQVIPANENMFTAELLMQLNDFADKYLVDYYGIKAKPAINRLSSAMKSIQSLAVLGFNPLYAAYNYINNITTRAAQGVFGFQSNKQIDRWYKRMGVKPAQLDVGVGLAGLPDDTHMGGQAIAAAMDVDDWIGKFRKVSSKAAKIGVFSNLAAKIEVSESRQATTIGMQQAWDKLWKPGVGFEKMSPEVESQLRQIHPQLPERIYSMTKQGLNMDEITKSLYTRSKFQGVESVMERAIQEVFTDSPDKAKDIIVKSGIKEEMVDLLGSDPSVEDINRTFDFLQSKIDSFIEQGIKEELTTIPEDARNRIQSEGASAMMPMWGELWSHFTARRLRDLIDNKIVAEVADAARAQGDYDMVRRLWRGRQAASDAQWKRTHNNMLVTAQGMIDAIGTDNPNAQNYVNIMSDWMDGWDAWHTDKKLILQKAASGDIEWDTAFEQIADNYSKHIETEKLQLTSMFESLGKWYEETSHRPAAEVLEWGQGVIDAWDQASSAVTEFRNSIDGSELTPTERRQAFETFNTETFAPLIKQQQNAMVEGAQFLSRIQPPPQRTTPLLTAGGGEGVPGTTPPLSTRFSDAFDLRKEINNRARAIGDYIATDKQRNQLARMIAEVYPNTEERHAVQRFLFDTNSVKMIKGEKVKAALDLFISIDEQGNEVFAIPENVRGSLEQALQVAREEAGQMTLDTKPADNDNPGEQARYNEQNIRDTAQDAVDEQRIHADAITNRNEFQSKLRDAFKLSSEEQRVIMSIADAHADVWGSKNGRPADAWYAENIGDVLSVDWENPEGLAETWIENGKHIIKAYQGADVESSMHELFHVFRFELDDADLNTVLDWAEYKGETDFKVMDQLWADQKLKKDHPDYQAYMDVNEKWADGGIKYIRDELPLDVAPPAMVNIFKTFSNWIRKIYKTLTGQGYDVSYLDAIEITPEIKNIFDRTLFQEDIVNTRQLLSEKLKRYPTGLKTDALGVNTHNKYNMQFKVVELTDLITSHTTGFQKNSLFPQELQSRFRELVANQATVIDIAQRLNPDELLNNTRLVEAGPMIIGPDMVVESGNGRTIALAIAMRDYPDNFRAYVDALTARLEDYGIAPESIEGIENPVLVRQRLDDVDRVAFADDANGKRTSDFSTLEQAFVDAKVWDKELLAELKVYRTADIYNILTSSNNEGVVQGFINGLPQNEKAKMFTAEGGLSNYGLEKMKAAIIARVFKGEKGKRLVSYFSESTSNTAANIQSSVENVLGEIAKVEGMIENNRLYPEMSIANDISDVVNAYLEINRRYGSFAEFQRNYENQASIFGDAYIDIGLVDPNDTPEIRNTKIDLLYFYAENSRRVDPQTQLWKRYTNRLLSEPQYTVGQIDMFGAQPTPKHELIRSVLQDLVNEGKTNEFRDYRANLQSGLGLGEGDQPSMKQARVITEVPQAGTPVPQYNGRMLDEVYTETLLPLLDQMREVALDDMNSGEAFALGDLPEDVNTEVQAWISKLPQQMSGTKLTAMRYGEMMRNRALLNYQERYGIDDYMNMVFPYQFWFTRTLGEWAKRSIEKPAWIATYARLRRHQKRMEQEGIPTRLKGKMRIPAPFLPDWMGDALYIDPLKQLFPFSQFATPFEMTAQQGMNVEYAAIQAVQNMVVDGRLTAKQAEKIIEEKEGPIWNEALAEGQARQQQEGDLNAMNLTSMMMTPAMWWTYPYHILKGTPEQLYPLPGTRTGQALREYGGPLSVIGSIMAYPEETIRKKFNLSAYGEWGDYYVDRTLANLAAEGVISSEEAEIAMLERQGEAYDIAYDRVQKEMSLKIPGSQTALALKEGRLGGILYTLPTTLFPAGLLPEGELKQRGLKVEYSKAWEAYEKGDPEAINKFFEENPEYQARLALFDEPQERLRQFLISEIWDKWTELDNKNKPLVANQLGENFEMTFLDSETRDYTAIDNETLAYWSQMIGGYVPDVEETGDLSNMPLYQQEGLQLYRPEVLEQVEQFQAQREQLFPSYKYLQGMYWELPENQRSGFVKQYPELKDYWEWKDQYYEQHPLVEKYQEAQQELYDSGEDIYTNTNVPYQSIEELTAQTAAQNMSDPLLMQVLFAYYSGGSVSGGARAMLMNTWENMGSPGGDFDKWLSMMMDYVTR